MNADSAAEATRKIVRSPELLAEARAKLDLVTRLTAPLTEGEVYSCLQPALILWGPPDHGGGDEGAALDKFWLATHTKAYRNLPKEALEFAVDQWIMRGKPYKFPVPSDLVALGEKKAIELRMVAWRLRQAADQAAERPRPEVSEEARKAARERIAAATKQLAARGMNTMSAANLTHGRRA